MNAIMTRKPDFIDLLSGVAGEFTANAPLAPSSWFRAGGAAELLYRPANRQALAACLAALPAEIPVTVIGAGSNLLVREGGVPGLVVQLGPEFAVIEQLSANRFRVGAGAMDVKLAVAARDAAIAGFEFLRGIPGMLGGAVKMNAGAYGGEICDIFVSASGVDRQGMLRQFSLADADFSYRHSAIPDEVILTEVMLQGEPGDADQISARLAAVIEARADAQPVNQRTGGSTFRNPPADLTAGRKAWELIDAAGCRGLRLGKAMVSEKHCNFLINTGGATADELEALGELVRDRVREDSGVDLIWEIRRIGLPADHPSETAMFPERGSI